MFKNSCKAGHTDSPACLSPSNGTCICQNLAFNFNIDCLVAFQRLRELLRPPHVHEYTGRLHGALAS